MGSAGVHGRFTARTLFLLFFRRSGPKGTGAYRIDFNAAARTFTIFSGSIPGGPWHSTTQTVSLDTLPLPPYVMSSFRVGLWARQWTSQNTVSLFSAISVSGAPTPAVTTLASASATSASLRLPPFIPYRVRVVARNANASWLEASNYTTGISLAPMTRVPFPLNASYAAALGMTYRYDFTAEGSSPGLAQSEDLSGNGFWLAQSSASRRPVVQPFAQGELSALRMRGTTANPLGYMQARGRGGGAARRLQTLRMYTLATVCRCPTQTCPLRRRQTSGIC